MSGQPTPVPIEANVVIDLLREQVGELTWQLTLSRATTAALQTDLAGARAEIEDLHRQAGRPAAAE